MRWFEHCQVSLFGEVGSYRSKEGDAACLFFGVHALETVNREQYPLRCACSLCFSVSRTPLFNNINTNMINKNNNNHRVI